MTKKRKQGERDRGPAGEKLAGPAPGATATGGRTTGVATPGEDRKKESAAKEASRSAYDAIRENLEAFIVAVILALIIRHFVVEAFEIPTGSMATTLYGMHAWVECPNCDTGYAVALASDSSTGNVNVPYESRIVYDGKCTNPSCALDIHSASARGAPVRCASCGQQFSGRPEDYRPTQAKLAAVRCPLCHHTYENHVFEKSNKNGGHKILVHKFAYQSGSPKRWDVIVFEFDEWKNYIKRLVGLPGERIEIWDGDLYVNGKVERKSDHPYAQDSLWTKISDSDVAERGLNPKPAWVEVAPPSRKDAPLKTARWNSETRRWSLNALNDVSVIAYQRGFDNYYSYNTLSQGSGGVEGYPHRIQVGDKKLAFVARMASSAPPPPGPPKAESWVGAEVEDGAFTFQLRIPVGPDAAGKNAVLERLPTGGAPGEAFQAFVTQTTAPVFRPGDPVEIVLENADDRVTASVGGKKLLALDYTSRRGADDADVTPPGAMTDAHALRIIASNAQADIESIRVHRDLYYISQEYRPWNGIQLGEGEYFAMGDNAPSSSDGRYWGAVPEKNLMGRALCVFWPAVPRFEWKFIR